MDPLFYLSIAVLVYLLMFIVLPFNILAYCQKKAAQKTAIIAFFKTVLFVFSAGPGIALTIFFLYMGVRGAVPLIAAGIVALIYLIVFTPLLIAYKYEKRALQNHSVPIAVLLQIFSVVVPLIIVVYAIRAILLSFL